MSGASNLTLSLTDGTQLPCKSERWEKGEVDRESTPFLSLFLSFFLSTHLAYFPVAADDFWALSSCWQHPVYEVIHTYSTVKRAHTCRSSHLPLAPVGSAPFTDVQFTAHSLLLLASLCLSSGVASDCCLNPDT